MLFKVLIVGSNGMVGQDLLRLFKNENYDIVECNTDNFTEIFEDITLYPVIFNCANEDVSEKILSRLTPKQIYIDNSSFLRRDVLTPLVIPEINFIKSNIYANPNCVTIILCIFLNSLKNYYPSNIKVSTYQSLSGAGKIKFNQFIENTKNNIQFLSTKDPFGNKNNNKLGFNFYPHESTKNELGFSGEEEKVIFETKKILDLDVFPTCIRIPAIRCHGEVITCQLEDFNKEKYLSSLNSNIIYDDKLDALSTEFETKIKLGHIKQNPLNKKEWSFFIIGDQLTRGASYNAFKIFIERMLLN